VLVQSTIRAGHQRSGAIGVNDILIRATAAATLAAALAAAIGTPASLAAAGDAPWCLIDWDGHSHCYYASSQDCLQAVASGDRGFCNVNPSAAAGKR
jgi:hypothetical protein